MFRRSPVEDETRLGPPVAERIAAYGLSSPAAKAQPDLRARLVAGPGESPDELRVDARAEPGAEAGAASSPVQVAPPLPPLGRLAQMTRRLRPVAQALAALDRDRDSRAA